jgi:hypothetical protein
MTRLRCPLPGAVTKLDSKGVRRITPCRLGFRIICGLLPTSPIALARTRIGANQKSVIGASGHSEADGNAVRRSRRVRRLRPIVASRLSFAIHCASPAQFSGGRSAVHGGPGQHKRLAAIFASECRHAISLRNQLVGEVGRRAIQQRSTSSEQDQAVTKSGC